MKQLLFAMVFMALAGSAAGPALAGDLPAANHSEQQQFFETLNDVPLMPGLYEMVDDSVVFDKPEGRIIESRAASEKLAGAQIKSFYKHTLPQMGWVPRADGSYVRDGETLTMNVEKQGNYSIVRFMVAPK